MLGSITAKHFIKVILPFQLTMLPVLWYGFNCNYESGLKVRARSSAWIERLPSKLEESRKSWDRSPPGPFFGMR